VSGGSRYVPGSAATAAQSADTSKADPFTGSTRYVPTNSSSSVAGRKMHFSFTAFYLQLQA